MLRPSHTHKTRTQHFINEQLAEGGLIIEPRQLNLEPAERRQRAAQQREAGVLGSRRHDVMRVVVLNVGIAVISQTECLIVTNWWRIVFVYDSCCQPRKCRRLPLLPLAPT
jgi:hypothetical protein